MDTIGRFLRGWRHGRPSPILDGVTHIWLSSAADAAATTQPFSIARDALLPSPSLSVSSGVYNVPTLHLVLD